MNKYKSLTLPQATLDFHQLGILNQSEIIDLTEKFLKDSQKQNLRKVAIITGKGLHSKNGLPVVKPIVKQYLSSSSLVSSFSEAPIDRGGTGALEVVL